jgi:hypothetical protein
MEGLTDSQEMSPPVESAEALMRKAIDAATVAETTAGSDVRGSRAWAATADVWARIAALRIMIDDRIVTDTPLYRTKADRVVNDDDRSDPYGLGVVQPDIDHILIMALMDRLGSAQEVITPEVQARLSAHEGSLVVVRNQDGSVTVRV